MSRYNYEDDDVYYGPGCCMSCCRALDVGSHDACGACYCRRSFKPDYDPDIYPGWSLGEYYPGRRLEDWTDTSNGPGPVTTNSNHQGRRGNSSRSTSDSTFNAREPTTTASETRQPSEKTPDHKDSDKSNEDKKKTKSKSFCEHPQKRSECSSADMACVDSGFPSVMVLGLIQRDHVKHHLPTALIGLRWISLQDEHEVTK